LYVAVLRESTGDDDNDVAVLPPGAAPSWIDVEHKEGDVGEQTTSKSTDVIVITSPVCRRLLTTPFGEVWYKMCCMVQF